MPFIAVIEDDCFTPEVSLDGLLAPEAGFHCEHIRYSAVQERLRLSSAQLILILPSKDVGRATALFEWLRDHSVSLPSIAILSEDNDTGVLQLATQTVDDFLFWPPRRGELEHRVSRLLGTRDQESASVRDRLRLELGLSQLIGNDPVFLQAMEKIPIIALSDAPVLITGETGTGKELCVRAIHDLSTRTNFPFVPVECGTIAEHLAENEFFGHARGAFTDAHTDQKGLVAMAEGGTLFLDEIDALSVTIQSKLLRLIEEGRYRSLGADKFSWANIRVVAATNRDVELCVRERQFRSDLYFRLNVFQLHLPALRERPGDIALLARHFLERFSRAAGKQPKTLSPAALRMLQRYAWPGNIRELRNVMQRAFQFCPGSQILASHVILPTVTEDRAPVTEFRYSKALMIERFEKDYIKNLLYKHNGNIARAAAEAGKDRRSFKRLMTKYGIRRDEFQGQGTDTRVATSILEAS
jgi:two-component system, NtrC family, response regulator GlrR